jgi:hypothetical protein
MGFSGLMGGPGHFKLAHSGSVPKAKLEQIATLLGIKGKKKTDLINSGKIHIVHRNPGKPRKPVR